MSYSADNQITVHTNKLKHQTLQRGGGGGGNLKDTVQSVQLLLYMNEQHNRVVIH